MANWWQGLEKKSKNMLTPGEHTVRVSSSTGIEEPGISLDQSSPEPSTTKGAKIMATEQTVEMENGELKTFVGKKKLIKETIITEDGSIGSMFYFLNGRVVSFSMPEEFRNRFAAHGIDQKFGDSIAGLADVEDCVLAIEDLREQIYKGEWSARREGSGMGGTSVLVRALMELTGKPLETIREYLSGKSQADKIALRNSSKLKPIVERIEAEKASKSSGVDGEALLAELEI